MGLFRVLSSLLYLVLHPHSTLFSFLVMSSCLTLITSRLHSLSLLLGRQPLEGRALSPLYPPSSARLLAQRGSSGHVCWMFSSLAQLMWSHPIRKVSWPFPFSGSAGGLLLRGLQHRPPGHPAAGVTRGPWQETLSAPGGSGPSPTRSGGPQGLLRVLRRPPLQAWWRRTGPVRRVTH